jgi:pre-mRNA-splicing factor SYF2
MSARELSSSSSAGSETLEQATVETLEESTPGNGEGKSTQAMIMEERMAKLERLRAKMVSFLDFMVI